MNNLSKYSIMKNKYFLQISEGFSRNTQNVARPSQL